MSSHVVVTKALVNRGGTEKWGSWSGVVTETGAELGVFIPGVYWMGVGSLGREHRFGCGSFFGWGRFGDLSSCESC